MEITSAIVGPRITTTTYCVTRSNSSGGQSRALRTGVRATAPPRARTRHGPVHTGQGPSGAQCCRADPKTPWTPDRPRGKRRAPDMAYCRGGRPSRSGLGYDKRASQGPWPAGCHIAYRSETRGNASGPPVGHGATAPGGDAHIANRSETRGNASGPPVKATDCLALETSCDTRPVGQPSLHWIPHQITKAGRPGHEPAPYLSQESDTGQISQARARGASGSVPRFTGPHCSRKTKPQPQPISKASTEQLPNGGSPGLQITRPAGKTHNAGFPADYTTTRGPTAAPSKSR